MIAQKGGAMKAFFILEETLVIVIGIIGGLAYGLFVALPRGVATFIDEEILSPATEKYDQWEKERQCRKNKHLLDNGTHGHCSRCGWTFCKPSGIIQDHKEFNKLFSG
jgi:hypothetical protein